MALRVFSRQLATRGQRIVWTHTDEAPALASYALLPVIQRFAGPCGVEVANADISVAARILATFPERLTAAQSSQGEDKLSQLGELAKTPDANIIKLPNVSASVPQLNEAIAELQGKGFDVPNYPAAPSTDAEKELAARYAKVLGSAVNPVLREGNSDRRVAAPVKAYAQANPHKMGAWDPACRSHVSHMSEGDFYASEQSCTVPATGSVRIELATKDGVQQLKTVALEAGEVIDSSVMSVSKLRDFFAAEIESAAKDDLMVSLHMKATMMKISDPIIFGHCVGVFFAPLVEKFGGALDAAGVNFNNGLGDLYEKLPSMDEKTRAAIEAEIDACYAGRPRLAMVDSSRGITNLHVPSDVIIDASMPVVVRDSGQMWNKDDALEDVKCLIPDRSYATMYKAVLEDCQEHGQFDVATMGNVCNVGLMAQKAEEYGSHDKTFELPADGEMRVVVDSGCGREGGDVLMKHAVAKGDIWRMCQTKDAPIRDWVRLAVDRAAATGDPAVFWLDEKRAHDASLIDKVQQYLGKHVIGKTNVAVSILPPVDAVKMACTRARAGQDTISVTGNVLRDYLTDLFPILELGTSAKMLSIVPLLAGGGLFETGAGGSAPKHVQQFVKEGHLRWDSLGEYLALAVSLQDLGGKLGDQRILKLGAALDEATGLLLSERKSPSRKVREIDNRGSTFYIARYWAEAMAKHDPSFGELAKALAENAATLVQELLDCQGPPVDIGGYYMPDPALVTKAMRPSATLNKILDSA
jgi:isocitrate dehydrogenase